MSKKNSSSEDISSRQLRALDAVACHGSFSAAARQLGYTEPAINYQIRTLEQSLGCRLVERDGAGVRLTADGEHALNEARRALDAMRRLKPPRPKDGRQERRREPAIRIAAGATSASHILPRLIAHFAANHPHVPVSLTIGTSDMVAQALKDDAVDIAVCPNLARHFASHSQIRVFGLVTVGVGIYGRFEPSRTLRGVAAVGQSPQLRKAVDAIGLDEVDVFTVPSVEMLLALATEERLGVSLPAPRANGDSIQRSLTLWPGSSVPTTYEIAFHRSVRSKEVLTLLHYISGRKVTNPVVR